MKLDHREEWKRNPKCHSSSLVEDVKYWATPIKSDSKRGSSTVGYNCLTTEVHKHIADGSEQRLNPAWAESLMGWPTGWSDPTATTSEFQGFPKGQGDDQHSYEAPRTIHKDLTTNRTHRIAMIGNGVVQQQVRLALSRLLPSNP